MEEEVIVPVEEEVVDVVTEATPEEVAQSIYSS